jgi:hypothetical protein
MAIDGINRHSLRMQSRAHKWLFKPHALIASSAVMIVGCAHNAGVIPIGNGTFMISRSEWGIQHTGATVKSDVIKQASEFCLKHGKELDIVNTSQQDMVPFKSEAQAEVEFRCH